jgi:hypothetical protein
VTPTTTPATVAAFLGAAALRLTAMQSELRRANAPKIILIHLERSIATLREERESWAAQVGREGDGS